MAFSSLSLYNTPGLAPNMDVIGDFPISFWGITRGTLEVDIQLVSWSIRGSYSAIWNLPLTNAKWQSDPWRVSVTSKPNFDQFHDLDTELDLHRITNGFHRAFATGVACKQRTLTLPDTWFRLIFWRLSYAPIVTCKTTCSFPELAVSFLDFSSWLLTPRHFLDFAFKGVIFCVLPFSDTSYVIHTNELEFVSLGLIFCTEGILLFSTFNCINMWNVRHYLNNALKLADSSQMSSKVLGIWKEKIG